MQLAVSKSITQELSNGQPQNQTMLFVAKDGEALDSQQKQDLELIVAQIMNPLLQSSDLN